MAKIGVSNFHYAICTKDDNTGVVYGTPKRIVGLNQVDVNPSVKRSTLYGDNQPLDTTSSVSENTIKIDSAYLPLEDKAALLGHQIVDGKMIVTADDKAPAVAIMFESEQSNGDIQYEKFYKGKFSEAQEKYKTRGENVEYQLHSLEGSFVARKYDKKVSIAMVSSDTTTAASWYASVDEI